MSQLAKRLVIVPVVFVSLTLVGCSSVPSNTTINIEDASNRNSEAFNEPKTETTEVKETAEIECEKKTIDDPELEKGQKVITTECKNGVKTSTFEVTLVNGQETERELVKEEITTEPIDEVTSIGTKEEPEEAAATSQCDPNYSGCVPVASDVDCAGGSGNGPAYAYGPVQVIGNDIYDLDRDGDGTACE